MCSSTRRWHLEQYKPKACIKVAPPPAPEARTSALNAPSNRSVSGNIVEPG